MERFNSRGQILIEVVLVLLLVGLASLAALQKLSDTHKHQKKYYFTKESLR